MSWPLGVGQVTSCSPDLHHLTLTVRRIYSLLQASSGASSCHLAALDLMSMGLLLAQRNQ